jgi:predicted nuclease of restriction endonuclease-like (RecB) superfamily
MSKSLILPTDYKSTLEQVKQIVSQARYYSLRAVNTELIKLYWEIGRILGERSQNSWGNSVIEKFSKDLNLEYPGIKGFSVSNLRYMRQFYTEYVNSQIHQQLVGEIPWGHNIVIFTKLKDETERRYYIENCAKFGWSRGVLEHKIQADEYNNHLQAQNNFIKTLDENKLALVRWEQKDEYNLSFLELEATHSERELEDAIVANIIKFMGELGGYFCFMGRQYRIVTDNNKEYFIDLLFYHRKLRCLVAIELKTVEFQSEFSGKMALYLNLLDAQVKEAEENSSIGIIICQSKDRLDVEYAIKDINRPIGVATYNFENLPDEISKYLPSKEDLEQTFKNNEK